MSKVKQLAKRLGGAWQYCGSLRWECEDGRAVQGCSRGVDQFDNPLPGGPVWHLYHPSGKAESFEWAAAGLAL